MDYMFDNAVWFNIDIGNWDVVKVTSIVGMFQGAKQGVTWFDQDISRWPLYLVSEWTSETLAGLDVVSEENYFKINGDNVLRTETIRHAVENMETDDIKNTYGDIQNWDTSYVTDMTSIFADKSSFTEDISNWNLSQVTDMSNMFHGAEAFNADISNWNVSKVTAMNGCFHNNYKFNIDIGNWDVSIKIYESYVRLYKAGVWGGVFNRT